MNPSALFTYARVSISRSASAHKERRRRNEHRVSRARNILRFRPSRFIFFIFFLLCSILHLLSLAIFRVSPAPLFSLSLSLSHFLTPLLTNLHILPFSCNGMHNPPFPFSSLSHLHPLVSLLSASRFLQFRRPLAFAFQTSRFFTVLSILLLICCLRQVYDSSRLKLRIHRNPCRER